MSDKSKLMKCQRHGESYATFLCSHLIRGEGLGFVTAYDPEDQRPEGWCSECDAVLLNEGEWNDRSEAFAAFKAICANCYDEVRRKNYEQGGVSSTGQNEIWVLDDALDMHLSYPDRFNLPDRRIRESLNVGDQAKLIFLLPGKNEEGDYWQGERMWVSITEVDEVGYWGVLDSIPVTKGSIQTGDVVLFGPEHVIDYVKDEDSKATGSSTFRP